MHLIANVLKPEELARLNEIFDAADSFVDGRKTAGRRAARVKRNEQLDADAEDLSEAQNIILTALNRNPVFRRLSLPKRVAPPLISRYGAGMSYGLHVDDAMMGRGAMRSDVSITVFLTDPNSYDGGELVIHNGGAAVAMVKGDAGSAVIYAANTLHRVAEVARGERRVAVTWCQSLVRSAEHRAILADLATVRDLLFATAPDADETDAAAHSYSNLLRLWAEP